MNYPKPDIFDPTPKEAPRYFFVPGYNFEIKLDCDALDHFSNGGGFLSAEGDWDDELEGFLSEIRGAREPSSFKTVINNSSNEWQEVSLFNSYKNRLATNYGNIVPISIASSDQSANYAAQMEQTENQVSEIGMVRVNMFRKPENIGFIEAYNRMGLQFEGQNPNGIPVAYRFNPIIDQHQFDLSTFEYRPPAGLLLNGFAGFALIIPPNSAIEIEILATAQRSGFMQAVLERREQRRQTRLEMKAAKRDAKLAMALRRRNER